MFFDLSPNDLKDGLDKIAVPVFAIDKGEDGVYRVAALNNACLKTTGLTQVEAFGATPHDLLANPFEARSVIFNYDTAMAKREEISYRETLTFRPGALTFDTTLHPVRREGEEAPRRLIGTAVQVVSGMESAARLGLSGDQTRDALSAVSDVIRMGREAGEGDLAAIAARVMIRHAQEAMEQLRQEPDGERLGDRLLIDADLPPDARRKLC